MVVVIKRWLVLELDLLPHSFTVVVLSGCNRFDHCSDGRGFAGDLKGRVPGSCYVRVKSLEMIAIRRAMLRAARRNSLGRPEVRMRPERMMRGLRQPLT